MKTLLLGNSHTGCILIASKEAGERLDTFGIPGGLGPDLEFADGYVKKGQRHGKAPKTNIPDALTKGVRLADYGSILFSTLGSADPQFANRRHPLVRFARADMVTSADPTLPLASQSLLELLIEAFVVGMFATQSLIALSQNFRGPIYVQPVPLPLRSSLDPTVTPTTALYGENATAVLSWYFKYQFGVMERIVGGLGPNVQLLPYPDLVALETGFSPDTYAVVQSNPWHLSDFYGGMILDQMKRLRTQSAGTVPA